MSWGEFLKPSWKRVIFAFVLFAVVYVGTFILFGPRPCTAQVYPAGQAPEGWSGCNFSFMERPFLLYLFLIGDMVVSYLLSCLIFKPK